MPYNLCEYCREPWDTDVLVEEAIGVFAPMEVALLAPLNTLVTDAWTYVPADTRHSTRALLATLDGEDELVTAAFTFWWAGEHPERDPRYPAARHLVGAAIRLGFERGLGCPDCGFHHHPGQPDTGDSRDVAASAPAVLR